jgi:peroxiredoxin
MEPTMDMKSKIQQVISNHPFIFTALTLAVSAAWIGFTAFAFPVTTNGLTPAPNEGFLAPDFTLETIEGQIYTLSELRGRPLLINFWATWCPPCRAEMPAMQRVYEAYQQQGFMILAVNATHQDSHTAALEFSRQYQLTFPILLDLDGSITRQYRVHSFPTSYFVDPTGLITEVVIGGPMAEALLKTRVESLLSGGE